MNYHFETFLKIDHKQLDEKLKIHEIEHALEDLTRKHLNKIFTIQDTTSSLAKLKGTTQGHDLIHNHILKKYAPNIHTKISDHNKLKLQRNLRARYIKKKQ